jgi:hypothetical protein
MALVGLLGALTVVTVATLWVLLKAGTWQLQAEMADTDVETTAPRVLLHHTTTIFKTVITAAVVVELWPGLSSWAYDAWYWILQFV